MEASQAHSDYAVIGVPIGEQGPTLVPEVSDIDGAERVIGMQVCSADDVVATGLILGEGLNFQPG
ncbi:MAG: hypothetical protein ACYSW3_11855 [Planctomycetota bacterium]